MLVISLSACSLSTHPVGFALDEDLSSDLTAKWINPKGEIDLQCDASGKIVISFEEEDKKTGEKEQEIMKGVIRSLEEDFYIVNVRPEEDGKEVEGYMFLLASFEDDEELVIWGSDVDFLEELVETGALAGKVNRYDVKLSDDGEKIARIILDRGLEKAFVWNKPIMFWRKESE